MRPDLGSRPGERRLLGVSGDGFHRPEADRTALGRLDAEGAPDTFDAAGYAALLARVRTGELVRAPAFQHGRPEWRAVRARLDLVWHVTVDPALRLDRLVARHVAAGQPPDVARAWVERVDEPNARLVDAAADRADLVLDLTAWSGRI